MRSTTPERRVYSVSEVAAVLGISRSTAYRLAAAGVIPTLRLGSRLVVPSHLLNELTAVTAPTALAN